MVKMGSWKVLIVDDEKDVHKMTKMILRNFKFQGKPLNILSAYSAKEVKDVLRTEHDMALIILDVVMEEKNSGLELVNEIRKSDSLVRIAIRTGQPGEAPERTVIREYDIHDYLEKGDIEARRLETMICSALRTYSALSELDQLKTNSEQKLNMLIKIVKFMSDFDYVKPSSNLSIMFYGESENSAKFSFSDLFMYFSGEKLLKIGRSLAVNPDRVVSIERIKSREIYLIMKNGDRLIVPRGGIDLVLEKFWHLLLTG
ncbi:response regulator [bacterium]|nr:response regulator [bacterium]